MGGVARIALAMGVAGLLSGTVAALAQVAARPARTAQATLFKVEVAGPGKAEPPAAEVKAAGGAAPEPVKVEVKAPDPVALQLIQQILPQFRPTLRGELHLIRVTCSPTPEQYRAIARDGEGALAESVREYAELTQRMLNGFAARANPTINLRTTFAGRMLSVTQQHLSDEQVVRYREVVARRTAARREGVARILVALLDESLHLRADQRDKLVAAFVAHWEDGWEDMITVLLHNPQYVLSIPDDVVSPILAPAQRTIWTAKVKLSSNNFWGGNLGQLGGVAIGEEPGLGDIPAEGPPVAAPPLPAGVEEVAP